MLKRGSTQSAAELAKTGSSVILLPSEQKSGLFIVTLENCKKGMGLSLSSTNVVNEIKQKTAASANSEIRVGDRVMQVDGVELGDRQVKDVIQPADSHALLVQRPEPPPDSQWTGTVWKKSPAGPLFQKRDVCVDGTTLKYFSGKGELVVLSCFHVERVKIVNSDKLEFALLTSKHSPELGRVYDFRVESKSEFLRWTQGLQKIVESFVTQTLRDLQLRVVAVNAVDT